MDSFLNIKIVCNTKTCTEKGEITKYLSFDLLLTFPSIVRM